ncbi:MAG: fumarate reductase/succinate dehydrogenase flavoprotein subunit, partial [Chloroflexota bacterium]
QREVVLSMLKQARKAMKACAAGAIDRNEVEATARRMLEPFERGAGEDPYAMHAELQETMQDLVGIIRTESELREALVRLDRLRERHARVGVRGGRRYNPGWHLALDLGPMLTVSEVVARSALERRESRGGHTREDFPKAAPEWADVNVVTRRRDGQLVLSREPLAQVPGELRALLGEAAEAHAEPVTIEKGAS